MHGEKRGSGWKGRKGRRLVGGAEWRGCRRRRPVGLGSGRSGPATFQVFLRGAPAIGTDVLLALSASSLLHAHSVCQLV